MGFSGSFFNIKLREIEILTFGGPLVLWEMVGTVFCSLIRKLEKAVAVSGVCAGVLEENCGKVPGKLLEKFSRIAKCYKF